MSVKGTSRGKSDDGLTIDLIRDAGEYNTPLCMAFIVYERSFDAVKTYAGIYEEIGKVNCK